MSLLRRVPRLCCPIRPRAIRQVTTAQKRRIPEFLWHGAEAYGFRGDVWTCPRVAKVIEWEFGAAYHNTMFRAC